MERKGGQGHIDYQVSGRPMKNCMDSIEKDMVIISSTKEIGFNIMDQRKIIHIVEPRSLG